MSEWRRWNTTLGRSNTGSPASLIGPRLPRHGALWPGLPVQLTADPIRPENVDETHDIPTYLLPASNYLLSRPLEALQNVRALMVTRGQTKTCLLGPSVRASAKTHGVRRVSISAIKSSPSTRLRRRHYDGGRYSLIQC